MRMLERGFPICFLFRLVMILPAAPGPLDAAL